MKLRHTSLAAVLVALAAASAACASDPVAGTPSATSAGKAAAATSAAAADAQSPSPAATAQVMFVANTGGTGVSRRDRCEDAARLAGPGLKDGTQVTIATVGTDQCAGWVQVDAAGTTSWVHLSYLATERPAAVAAPAPAAPRPPVASGGGTTPPPPVAQPRFEKVLVYKEHLIPLSQLTYRSADFGPILMTPTGPKPGAYICPAYNYSAPTVRTTAGVILQDPDPEGCGFARSDAAVIRDALIQ